MPGRVIFFFASCCLISEVVERMYSMKDWRFWILYLAPTVYFYNSLFG